jgi:hypothetical protein
MTVAGVALLIAIAFLCAAGFIFVNQRYGVIAACIAGAILFLIVMLIAFIWSAAVKWQYEARARQRAKAARNILADPALLVTGLQVVRAIGVKRLIPLLAVGGLALGVLASRTAARPDTDRAPAE